VIVLLFIPIHDTREGRVSFYGLAADRQEYCFTKDFFLILFFYSETNKNVEKLRGWTPGEFSMRIWKKSGFSSKINFKKIKLKKNLL